MVFLRLGLEPSQKSQNSRIQELRPYLPSPRLSYLELNGENSILYITLYYKGKPMLVWAVKKESFIKLNVNYFFAAGLPVVAPVVELAIGVEAFAAAGDSGATAASTVK